jgi:outer membrane lipoprotein-sorting protein
MSRITRILAVAALAAGGLQALPARSADEIVARYVKAIGGMEKLSAIKTLKRSGKFTSPGGSEARVVQENKRPDRVRQELTQQGMVGVTAYDGTTGWKIEPWRGKKDVESLGENELKAILEDADFDGPLVGYREKGNQVELAGAEPIEGTDTYKLKVTLKNGDVLFYFMDAEFFVPIKIERKRIVRGAERESETMLGDYKEVAGVYYPHSYESGAKGNANRAKTVYDRIEANVPLDDSEFKPPAPVAGK